MDNDSLMITSMCNALITLQVKYRGSKLEDRMQLRPALQEVINDFAGYQIRLLKEGVITTKEDMEDMMDLGSEIDAAATKQQLFSAFARTIAFVAIRV